MKIRTEKLEDYQAIQHVNGEAFGGVDEAELVDQLRHNTLFNPELSLVAIDKGEVIGHILFFPIHIQDEKNKYSSLALAPMSVLPKCQKKGIGSELVKVGFEKAKELGYTSVIVLGHPEYYPRFGFLPALQFDIQPPVKEWSSAFFVKELECDALAEVSGTVVYPAEFGV